MRSWLALLLAVPTPAPLASSTPASAVPLHPALSDAPTGAVRPDIARRVSAWAEASKAMEIVEYDAFETLADATERELRILARHYAPEVRFAALTALLRSGYDLRAEALRALQDPDTVRVHYRCDLWPRALRAYVIQRAWPTLDAAARAEIRRRAELLPRGTPLKVWLQTVGAR